MKMTQVIPLGLAEVVAKNYNKLTNVLSGEYLSVEIGSWKVSDTIYSPATLHMIDRTRYIPLRLGRDDVDAGEIVALIQAGLGEGPEEWAKAPVFDVVDTSGVDWAGYVPYVSPHPGVARDLPRKLAQENFDHWFERREQRWLNLQRLLDFELETSDDGLRQLNGWFDDRVRAHPLDPSRPSDIWYDVALDIGTVLGDIYIQRHPIVHWGLMTKGGRRNAIYHEVVVTGFPKIEADFGYDYFNQAAAEGSWALSGKPDIDRFVFLMYSGDQYL